MAAATNKSSRKWNGYPMRNFMTYTGELQALCTESFSRLQLPDTWKIKGYDTCRLTQEPESEIQSIGMIVVDTATSGMDTTTYRIAYHVYSERLHLCQKSIVDYGKYKYSCLASYYTPERLNEFIKQYLLK